MCNPLEYYIQLIYVALLVFLGILFATWELAQPYWGFNTNSTNIYIDVAFFVFLGILLATLELAQSY